MRRCLVLLLFAVSLPACDVTRSGLYVDSGSRLSDEGRYAEAVVSYEKAIRILPENGPARVGLGNALWQLGRKQECLRAYREAIGVAPEYSPAYSGLAYYLVQLGRPDEAVQMLTELARVQPGNAQLYGEIGVVHLGMGRYSDALVALDRAASLDPRILDDVPRLRKAREEAEEKARSRGGPTPQAARKPRIRD